MTYVRLYPTWLFDKASPEKDVTRILVLAAASVRDGPFPILRPLALLACLPLPPIMMGNMTLLPLLPLSCLKGPFPPSLPPSFDV